jgi:hypothetical protein
MKRLLNAVIPIFLVVLAFLFFWGLSEVIFNADSNPSDYVILASYVGTYPEYDLEFKKAMSDRLITVKERGKLYRLRGRAEAEAVAGKIEVKHD